MERRVDRRIDERHPAGLEVRVTQVEAPDFSASGQVVDISEAGIGVYLPLQFMPGSAVRLNINDSEERRIPAVSGSSPRYSGDRP
jgi:PilZ domain